MILEDLRAFEDKRQQLVQSGQPFFRLEVVLQPEFLPLLEPFLIPIVILPQKVRPNLVVHHPFDGVLGIADGQPDDHGAHGVDVVVDHAGCRDGVLCELVGQHVGYA